MLRAKIHLQICHILFHNRTCVRRNNQIRSQSSALIPGQNYTLDVQVYDQFSISTLRFTINRGGQIKQGGFKDFEELLNEGVQNKWGALPEQNII